MKKFTQVKLEKQLRSNSDGMPVFRDCFQHELLLSFTDDLGREEFESWWKEEGSFIFGNHLELKGIPSIFINGNAHNQPKPEGSVS